MTRLEQPVRFVLVAPSHPGNIGSSARAIFTMGFGELHVVAPREKAFRVHPEAIALAAGAVEILQAAPSHLNLMSALQGVNLSFAMTGYPREFGPPMVSVEHAAQRAHDHIKAGSGAVAFVFGCERNGLPNEDIERCTASCSIDADAKYGSLNLSQAVQIAAYECRRAGLAGSNLGDESDKRAFAVELSAGANELEGLVQHLGIALMAVGFLDPRSPRHLMSRVRRMLTRAALSTADVAILRGICSAMIEPKSARAGRGAANSARRAEGH